MAINKSTKKAIAERFKSDRRGRVDHVQLEEMLKEYADGLSIEDLAAKYNIKPQTVKIRIKAFLSEEEEE